MPLSCDYLHTQQGRMHYLMYLCAAGAAIGAVAAPAGPVTTPVLACAAAVFLATAFMFRTLTVEDQGVWLLIRFGPLPLFQKRVPYDEIRAVERDRAGWGEGCGIHYHPGRGWIWILAGRDCVRLDVNGKPLRIGTDDPEGLVEFLRKRIVLRS